MRKTCFKLIAVLVSVVFVVSIMPRLEGAQFYFQPRNKGRSEVGLRIPFGAGSQPHRESIIDKLKEEETKGTPTAVGLVILGACLIVATVILVNKADDIKSEVVEKADEIKDEIKDN